MTIFNTNCAECEPSSVSAIDDFDAFFKLLQLLLYKIYFFLPGRSFIIRFKCRYKYYFRVEKWATDASHIFFSPNFQREPRKYNLISEFKNKILMSIILLLIVLIFTISEQNIIREIFQ